MPARVLIPTMQWPPMGGVGVRRKAKMAKYLARAGVDVKAVTVRNTPGVGAGYAADIADARISTDTIRAYSIHDYARRDLKSLPAKALRQGVLRATAPLFPVDYGSWWRFAVRPHVRRLVNEGWGWVYASGMPFSTVHDMAVLKRELGDRMVLVAEWRDLWTDFPGRHYPFPQSRSRALNQRCESETLEVADVVVAVTEAMADTLRGRSPHPDRVVVIPNGYDPDDFVTARPWGQRSLRLAYTGDVGPTRIEGLLVIVEAVAKLRASGVDATLEVMGPLGGQHTAIEGRAAALGMAEAVILHGNRAPSDALALLGDSRYAAVVVQREHPEALPSKFFDAIGSGAALIAVGPAGGDLQRATDAYGLGRYVAYDDGSAASELSDFVLSGSGPDAAGLEQARASYSFEGLAAQLIELFEAAGERIQAVSR